MQSFGLVVLIDNAPAGQVHRRCGRVANRVADYDDFFAGTVTYGVDQRSFDVHDRTCDGCWSAAVTSRASEPPSGIARPPVSGARWRYPLVATASRT